MKNTGKTWLERAMYHPDNDNSFLEHFADHLVIATSFFFIGVFVCLCFIKIVAIKRIRIDHKFDGHYILRVFNAKGEKLIVANPSKVVDFIDVIFLSLFDKGRSNKPIEQQDVKRIRILRRILITFISVIIYSGIVLVFSAFKVNLDVMSYMKEFAKHIIYHTP